MDPVRQFAVLIIAHDNMFGRRDETVLDPPIPADLVLVGAGMKKAYIKRFPILDLWQEYFVDMFL